jgi:hypothetical protein
VAMSGEHISRVFKIGNRHSAISPIGLALPSRDRTFDLGFWAIALVRFSRLASTYLTTEERRRWKTFC